MLTLVNVLMAVLNVNTTTTSLILGVTSPVCSEGNIVTSKIGAGVILKSLLNINMHVNHLPFGGERGIMIETVVPVNDPVREAEQVMKF